MTGSIVVRDGGLTAATDSTDWEAVEQPAAARPPRKLERERPCTRRDASGGRSRSSPGAGTGIGRATCVRFAEEGAEVVVTSQNARLMSRRRPPRS